MAKKAPARVRLTGTDHLCAQLLSAMYGPNSANAAFFLEYRDRARQILASPDAFDDAIDTLDVTDATLRSDRLRHMGDDPRSKEYNRLLEAVLETEADDANVTGHAEDFRSMLYSAISEAQLLGAALMFELLKDGAR